jgi:hypothetical protein
MVHLITPHYQRKRFFRPKRRGKAWRTIRRYQLLELFAFTGAIALVWLGAQLDNRSSAWNQPPQPAGVESASADLIIGVPIGARQAQRRPL